MNCIANKCSKRSKEYKFPPLGENYERKLREDEERRGIFVSGSETKKTRKKEGEKRKLSSVCAKLIYFLLFSTSLYVYGFV